MPSALHDRLAARRAAERLAVAAHPIASPRRGYPPDRPNAERTLKPASEGFGALLRGHRLRRGFTLGALGRRAGTDHAAVWRLEGGNRHPSRAMIARLAAALDLDDDATAELTIAAGFLPAGYVAVKAAL